MILGLKLAKTGLVRALVLFFWTHVDDRVDHRPKALYLHRFFWTDLVAGQDDIALFAEHVQSLVEPRKHLSHGFRVVLEIVGNDVHKSLKGTSEDLYVVDRAVFKELYECEENVRASFGLLELLTSEKRYLVNRQIYQYSDRVKDDVSGAMFQQNLNSLVKLELEKILHAVLAPT